MSVQVYWSWGHFSVPQGGTHPGHAGGVTNGSRGCQVVQASKMVEPQAPSNVT